MENLGLLQDNLHATHNFIGSLNLTNIVDIAV
jgi:hypothetical protein